MQPQDLAPTIAKLEDESGFVRDSAAYELESALRRALEREGPAAVVPTLVRLLERETRPYPYYFPATLLALAAERGADLASAVPALEAASRLFGTNLGAGAARALSLHYIRAGVEQPPPRAPLVLSPGWDIRVWNRPIQGRPDEPVTGQPARPCGACGGRNTACIHYSEYQEHGGAQIYDLEYACRDCGRFTAYASGYCGEFTEPV